MLGLSAFWWGAGIGVAAALFGGGVWAWVKTRAGKTLEALRP